MAQSDNFNDNMTGPQWTVIEDNASQLAIAEQNQHLEITANAPASPNLDAIYLSNGAAGFKLSTAQNFQISIAYNFSSATSTGPTGSALALDFGVGGDVAGNNSAAVAFGYANTGAGVAPALGVSYRDNGVQTNQTLVTSPSSGVFQISYNSASDALTLGVGSSTYTLSNTVRGVWGADSLYTSFGGRGDGFNVAAGNAVLDNFSVDSGVVVAPEPSSARLLCICAAVGAFVSRKR